MGFSVVCRRGPYLPSYFEIMDGLKKIRRGGSKKAGSKEEVLSGSPASLLELQLEALERGLRVSPPAAGVEGSSSSVLFDFVSFLKHFFHNEFRPLPIVLDAAAAAAVAGGGAAIDPQAFTSPRAAAIFSQVPGNSKATSPVWTAPRPSRVEVVGSCGVGVGPPAFSRNLDLALELPEEAFDRRDYLNYR